SANLYEQANTFVKTLNKDEDFTYDEKSKGVQLSESGSNKAENFFKIDNVFDLENVTLTHHINQALRANDSMQRDTDYVIEEESDVIVDQLKGWIIKGRRYSDEVNQAIEA